MFQCLATAEQTRARNIMKEVKKGMKKQRDTEMEQAVKILLLGTGASGKTTFVKQMKILKGNGFTDKEKESYIPKVQRDILNTSFEICTMIQSGTLQTKNPDTQKILQEVFGAMIDNFSTPGPEDLLRACRAITDEEELYNIIKKRLHNQMPDSAPYFLDPDNYERILKDNYEPTPMDILFSRTPTTGVVNHMFHVDKGALRVLDVGGQQVERKKWITQFDGVDFIMYVCDCSAFDKCAEHNENLNSLVDSLSLGTGVVKFNCFTQTGIMIFFNKMDLLEQKLKRVKFADFHSRYDGDNSFESVKKYVEELVRSELQSKGSGLYVHFTVGTDSENFRHVLDAVIAKIYSDNVDQYTS